MSVELLEKFINAVDEEDGIREKVKKRPSKLAHRDGLVCRLLSAAERGQVQLPDEESFLITPRSKTKKKGSTVPTLNDRWASQGFSLVDQIRSEKPHDLLKRNIKYMNYAAKRKLDGGKAHKMMVAHMQSIPNKKRLREDREKVDCLRAPKKTKKNNGSVFSEKDFQSKKKMTKKIQNEDGSFI